MYLTELLKESMESTEECLALGRQSKLVGFLPCLAPHIPLCSWLWKEAGKHQGLLGR